MTECHHMLQAIARTARETARLTGRGRFAENVMTAIRSVQRSRFVPDGLVVEAYENIALPIGFEQTISQPYIVALMTDLLRPEKDHICLEVGTGSGYQAAVLSLLVKHVYTIEIIAPLFRQASSQLHDMHYENIHPLLGNGYLGYPDAAPYDRIIVTAAAEKIPSALIEQLKKGGRMMIPIGPENGAQVLYQVDKDVAGEVTMQPVLDVRFVPLIEGATLAL